MIDKDLVDIVQVIGDHLDLRKTGEGRFIGLCPFHSERNPSFTVFQDEGRFYCFGCHKSGDWIGFLKDFNNWDLGEVDRYAVDRWGEGIFNRGEDDLKEKMNEIARLWHLNLREGILLDKVLRMGITLEEVDRYLLGFSNDIVHGKIVSRFGLETLRKLGLIGRSGDSVLNQRVTFPLRDERGEIVAFQARSLFKNSSSKYIMSYNSPLFKKKEYLFGMDSLRQGEEYREIIMVEGVKDSIKLSSLGYRSLAILGSSVSMEVFERVASIGNTRLMYLMFDHDVAGLKVRNSFIKLYFENRERLSIKWRLRLCELPIGMDPADLCNLKPEKVELILYRSLSPNQIFSNRHAFKLGASVCSFESFLIDWFKAKRLILPNWMALFLAGLGFYEIDKAKTMFFPSIRDIRNSRTIITYLRLHRIKAVNLANRTPLKQNIQRVKFFLIRVLNRNRRENEYE